MQLKFTAAASLLPKLMSIALMLVSPMYGISQGPSNPTDGGGAPAGESGAVPFDNNMNLLFLAVGLGLVAVKMWSHYKGQKATT